MNDKVACIAHGAETAEGGDDLVQRDMFQRFMGVFRNLCQALCGGGRICLVIQIRGGGAEEEVAVHGRRGQDALSLFGGGAEYGMGEQAAALSVQQQVFPAAGTDTDGIVPGKACNLVRVKAGGVYDVFCPYSAARHRVFLRNLVVSVPPRNLCRMEIQQQLGAVVHGVAHGRHSQLIGADNGAGGGIQGAGDCFR